MIKKVKEWVAKTQPTCEFVNWVIDQSSGTRRPSCRNVDNPQERCVYKYCPKVLNKNCKNCK